MSTFEILFRLSILAALVAFAILGTGFSAASAIVNDEHRETRSMRIAAASTAASAALSVTILAMIVT